MQTITPIEKQVITFALPNNFFQGSSKVIRTNSNLGLKLTQEFLTEEDSKILFDSRPSEKSPILDKRPLIW